MNSVIINNCEVNRGRIEDCDLSGAKIMSRYIIDLDFIVVMMVIVLMR